MSYNLESILKHGCLLCTYVSGFPVSELQGLRLGIVEFILLKLPLGANEIWGVCLASSFRFGNIILMLRLCKILFNKVIGKLLKQLNSHI